MGSQVTTPRLLDPSQASLVIPGMAQGEARLALAARATRPRAAAAAGRGTAADGDAEAADASWGADAHGDRTRRGADA